jgi:hypothetical protein
MSGKASRRKGQDFEREMVRRLAEVFGEDKVRRGLQYREGSECPDVQAPAFWIECKRGKRTNPRAALEQASQDSIGKGVWPAAICKEDRSPATVTLFFEDFAELLREWWAGRMVVR